MKVLYSPPDDAVSYIGTAVYVNVIDNAFYFLLMLDDGRFKQAKCSHCKVMML